MTALKKPAKPKLPADAEFFFDVEQGSDEWRMLRLGIPTAGSFATILANGKDGGASETRKRYMYQKAAEILSGEPGQESYINDDMRRGLEMEPDAAAYYARTRFVECVRVGFVRRKLATGRYVGASPDFLIDDRRLIDRQYTVLEIKCPRREILLEIADRGRFPTEYRAQCHGLMWITGANEIVLLNYHHGLPVEAVFTLERNELYIREIDERVQVFDWELAKLVERLRDRSRGQ